jgi:DnaJ-class molecular chaperone
MARDHYLVLGVSRSETEGGIQPAFRVMAKRLHPDVAGAEVG